MRGVMGVNRMQRRWVTVRETDIVKAVSLERA